jgi:hypothetical protein
MIFKIKLYIYLIFLCLLLSPYAFGQEIQKYVAPLVPNAAYAEYGYVDHYAHLSKMVPADAVDAVKDLADGQYSKARTELQNAVRQHPSSLSLFVALTQDTPDTWASQIQAYEKRPFASLSRSDKFKYATLLFYHWGTYRDQDDKVNHAEAILYDLWQKDHEPIIGLMLASELDLRARRVNGLTFTGIYEALLHDLGGEKVYKKFEIDQKNGLKDDPPSVDLVPVQKRVALENIVHCYWGLSTRQWGEAKMVNGHLIPLPPKPYTPFQLAEQKYLKTWSKNLLASKSTQ